MNNFEKYFIRYYPIQSYSYYYNHLYNSISLNKKYNDILDSYLAKIKQYISGGEYDEGFKILKSIICAYKDTNVLNFNSYIENQFSNIGMLLRIIYRKCNDDIRLDIYNWIRELEINNYYDNLYVEDLVLMIDYMK